MSIHWPGSKTLRTILLLSLCAHLAVAVLARHGVIKDDSESYVLIGTNLAEGHGYVFQPGAGPTAWRGPGYPFMLAGIFKLTHNSYEAVRFVQAFLWVGVALCAWKIALILFGPEAAWVAGVIAGFYPEFLGFTGLLWSESLFTLLFSASVVCFVSLLHSPRASAAVALGLFLGASILTRSAAITLVGAIVVACLAGRMLRAHGAIAVLLAALIVAPWTARNFQDYGRFMLVESNSTQNLFEGARPYTPLIFGWRSTRYLHSDPVFESLDHLPEGQRYGALGKVAVQYIASHPARYALMLFTKTIDFWLPDFFISRNIGAGSVRRGVPPSVDTLGSLHRCSLPDHFCVCPSFGGHVLESVGRSTAGMCHRFVHPAALADARAEPLSRPLDATPHRFLSSQAT